MKLATFYTRYIFTCGFNIQVARSKVMGSFVIVRYLSSDNGGTLVVDRIDNELEAISATVYLD
jgi:hypothetical protein